MNDLDIFEKKYNEFLKDIENNEDLTFEQFEKYLDEFTLEELIVILEETEIEIGRIRRILTEE